MLYISVAACLGSITFAFLLQRKYQDILQVSFSDSVRPMTLYSLPTDIRVRSAK